MNRKSAKGLPPVEARHHEAAQRLTEEVWAPAPVSASVPMDELATLLAALELDAVPAPSPSATGSLAAELGRMMGARRRTVWPVKLVTALKNLGAGLADVVTAVRPQVGLFRPAFWVVSAFVLVLGTAAAALSDLSLPAGAFVALAGVLGMAYAMRSAAGRALEIELSCPVDPVSLVAARSLIVLTYDLVLTILLYAAGRLSGRAAAIGLDGATALTIVRLVAPLVFFSALTLVTTVRFGPLYGLTVAVIAWAGALIVGRLRPALDVFLSAGWPVEGALLGLGLALAATALLTSGHLATLAVRAGGDRR